MSEGRVEINQRKKFVTKSISLVILTLVLFASMQPAFAYPNDENEDYYSQRLSEIREAIKEIIDYVLNGKTTRKKIVVKQIEEDDSGIVYSNPNWKEELEETRSTPRSYAVTKREFSRTAEEPVRVNETVREEPVREDNYSRSVRKSSVKTNFESIEKSACERGFVCASSTRSEFLDSSCEVKVGMSCSEACDEFSGQCTGETDWCQSDAECNEGKECFEGALFNVCVPIENLVCEYGWYCDVQGQPEREMLLNESCSRLESNVCENGCNQDTGRCVVLNDCEVGWGCVGDYSKYFDSDCEVVERNYCYEGCNIVTGECNPETDPIEEGWTCETDSMVYYDSQPLPALSSIQSHASNLFS